jgi:rfaE bifunctional protein nucleotidyltransferase chain/domain
MDKILTVEKLAQFAAEAKAKGKKVVMAHGCFDLLHPGHIRHLKAARKYGDILIITVTPDRFVNKGPGRPAFSEKLRLESLAALEFVNAVALNKWPTAVETIKFIKPDVYVKGLEYSEHKNDPTGKILNEKVAVEEVGGKLEFTDEITFSSSSVLNKNFGIFSRQAEEYLMCIAEKYSPEKIQQLFEPMQEWTAAVIGDTIVDEYSYVHPMGRVEKAPIVACRYLGTELFAGGILAVANHIAGFVKQVELVTVAGNDDMFSKISSKLAPNIKVHLYKRQDGPTTLKRRYLNREDLKKMFAIEFMNDMPILPETESLIMHDLPGILKNSHLTVAADFGHGAITQKIITQIEKYSKFLAVNAQTNSSNFGFNPVTRFPNAHFISIDETELRIATTSRFDGIESMLEKLREKVKCPKINITLGQRGSHYFSESDSYCAPALAGSVLDTVGAGDAVLAVLSLCATAGFPDEIMPFIGNCAGAIMSNILCNESSVTKANLLKMIKTTLSWR